MSKKTLVILSGLVLIATIVLRVLWPDPSSSLTIHLRCPEAAVGTVVATWNDGATRVEAPLDTVCGEAGLVISDYNGSADVDLAVTTQDGDSSLTLTSGTHILSGPADYYAVLRLETAPSVTLTGDGI